MTKPPPLYPWYKAMLVSGMGRAGVSIYWSITFDQPEVQDKVMDDCKISQIIDNLSDFNSPHCVEARNTDSVTYIFQG